MLECIRTDSRKSSIADRPPRLRRENRCSHESTFSWHVPLEPEDNDSSQPGADDCSPRSERRPSVNEQLLLAGGVMRERTAPFLRLRASIYSGRQGVPSRDDDEHADARTKELSDELSRTFKEASSLHTSLASKLAQHNGVRQFAADFTNRAPPLEIRMLLPQLEAAIEELLDRLEPLGARMRELQSTAIGRNHQLCESLAEHVANTFEKSSKTFKEQHEGIQVLAAASPISSPVLAPALRQRLATAMSGSSSQPSSTTASPRASPRMWASPKMSPRGSPHGSPSLASRLRPVELPPAASCVADLEQTEHRGDETEAEKIRGGYGGTGRSKVSPFHSVLAAQVRRALQVDVSQTSPCKYEDMYQEVFDVEMVIEGCSPLASPSVKPWS